MSGSRLQRSTSRSRTFLDQNIELRQFVRERHDHQSVSREKYQSESHIKRRHTQQPKKRLDSSLRLQSLPQKDNDKHSSASSQAGERRTLSRLDNLKLIEKINLLRTNRAQGKKGLQEAMKKTNSLRENNHPISLVQQKPIPDEIKPQSQLQIPRLPINPLKQESISSKLASIDERISHLVSKKLKLISDQTSARKDMSESVFRFKKTAIDDELLILIQDIRSLKNNNTFNEVTLLNKKIAFIETLLAQQATEGELMKKYYYGLNSNKKKGKNGDFNHVKYKMADVYRKLLQFQKEQKGANERNTKYSPKPIFEETTSKEAYKQPKQTDYESYRYRQKNVALNLQPLSRSSYQRQFLYLKSQPDQKIVNRDHSPFSPHSKQPVGSTYDQHYKTLSVQIPNHKQLDAYQNKYKVLQVNYMPRNRMDSLTIDKDSYTKDHQIAGLRIKTEALQRRFSALSEHEKTFNKQILQSSAHREYNGEPSFERSRIKHQQLHNLQYKLKNLYKS